MCELSLRVNPLASPLPRTVPALEAIPRSSIVRQTFVRHSSDIRQVSEKKQLVSRPKANWVSEGTLRFEATPAGTEDMHDGTRLGEVLVRRPPRGR